MGKIAIVCPTIRPESFKGFVKGWWDLIEQHEASLITVWDGDKPKVEVNGEEKGDVDSIMGDDNTLIFNRNDGVRNLGFAYIAKEMPEIETIITLDDDTMPIGDPIQDHLNALDQRVSTSWISTSSEYTRGFPYGTRTESEVVLSHGVWEGVKDYDAPTQLVNGNKDVTFYKGPIPKGVYYPMCGMNLAFKRKMLPYMYFAPMGYKVGIDRFADIWCGITSKRVIDDNDWAVVTGYAKVRHDRASNVYKNLQKEAEGIDDFIREGGLDRGRVDQKKSFYKKLLKL